MLTLQRASAGSGKTYSLAKMYLHQLLAIRDENTDRYRLRSPAETRGAHSHLLAITFTNKATAEMRKRFVDNLAKLAKADTHTDKVDYLEDFMTVLNASRAQVAQTARAALSDILNHYSDFQVSTIDSFFQQILRSFTYEAELPDNYDVELDSDLVIGMAFDSLMHTARTDVQSDEAFWIRQYTALMLQNGRKWNLSQHNGQARRDLFSYLKMMDSEAFKKQRTILDKYFSEHKSDLRSLPAKVEELGIRCIVEAHSHAVGNAEELIKTADKAGEDGYINANLRTRIEKVCSADANKYPFTSDIKPYANPLKSNNKKRIPGIEERIKELDTQLANAIIAWRGSSVYVDKVRLAVPVVMLVYLLQRHLEKYRTDNNVVQLSDTNTILQTITGDSDIPFIYEKIGTQIDSYMIDEFQDTSELQWNNMSPLVDESLGRGNDNLIIGDAKQSIYRFRNADSTLITSKVPEEYGRKGHKLEICGKTTAENANWRSAPDIVRFNNSLFTYLAGALHTEGSIADIASTYNGICQEPKKTGLQGYVRLESCFVKKTDSEADTEETDTDMPYLIPCITSLLGRGYKPKEIAVLVRTHKEGRAAVNTITNYSATLPIEKRIDVISDESLLISNANAVSIITTMLRAVRTDGVKSDKPSSRPEQYSRRVDVFIDTVNRLRSNAPELTSEKILSLYFSCEATKNDVRQLLKDSPSMALPALVERIIGSDMVPEEMRRQEAAFISAFQDAVANFSEHHQPDVAAFLNWWDDNKDSLTITSPEDADAIQVITIHKAKGLEWKCVIVPNLTCDLTLTPTERAWLDTRAPFNQVLPPLLPVQLNSKKAFANTPWQQDYTDIVGQHRLDILNLVYVAFTRAKDELYVFTMPKKKREESKSVSPKKKIEKPKEPDCISDYLIGLKNNTEWLTQKCEFGIEQSKLQLNPKGNETGLILTYGRKPSPEYIEARRTKEEEEKKKEGNEPNSKILEDYEVNMDIPDINYTVGDLPPSVSEGTVRRAVRIGDVEHAILEGIRPGHNAHAEADRLLLRALIRGQITESEHKDLRRELHLLLDKPQARQWFGSEVKVYAERSIVDGGYHRPDRIVVDKDNVATVIDYKTGTYHSTHEEQVSKYMRLLRQTGLFTDVRGMLWYLNPEWRKKGEFVSIQ